MSSGSRNPVGSRSRVRHTPVESSDDEVVDKIDEESEEEEEESEEEEELKRNCQDVRRSRPPSKRESATGVVLRRENLKVGYKSGYWGELGEVTLGVSIPVRHPPRKPVYPEHPPVETSEFADAWDKIQEAELSLLASELSLLSRAHSIGITNNAGSYLLSPTGTDNKSERQSAKILILDAFLAFVVRPNLFGFGDYDVFKGYTKSVLTEDEQRELYKKTQAVLYDLIGELQQYSKGLFIEDLIDSVHDGITKDKYATFERQPHSNTGSTDNHVLFYQHVAPPKAYPSSDDKKKKDGKTPIQYLRVTDRREKLGRALSMVLTSGTECLAWLMNVHRSVLPGTTPATHLIPLKLLRTNILNKTSIFDTFKTDNPGINSKIKNHELLQFGNELGPRDAAHRTEGATDFFSKLARVSMGLAWGYNKYQEYTESADEGVQLSHPMLQNVELTTLFSESISSYAVACLESYEPYLKENSPDRLFQRRTRNDKAPEIASQVIGYNTTRNAAKPKETNTAIKVKKKTKPKDDKIRKLSILPSEGSKVSKINLGEDASTSSRKRGNSSRGIGKE